MCGIFGVLRKPGAPRIRGAVPFEAMEIVRHRGSGLGGGFARSTAYADSHAWTIRACFDHAPRDIELRTRLAEAGFAFDRLGTVERIEGGAMPFWTGHATKVPMDALAVCDHLNEEYLKPGRLDARIVSCSRRVDVWKDVAHPAMVATGHGLQERRGDAWLGHTREPTNSPGKYPIWSHPFTMGDVAIVHNGDLSSYGANMRYLRKRGYTSFTGTDSEVIAILLHHLLAVEGMDPFAAAETLVDATRGEDPAHAAAALDGPFAACCTWSTPDETFLLVLLDRQKLRPLVLGEDDHAFYAASEESQIRRVSPDADVWTPEPGTYFLASSTRGILSEARRERRPKMHPAQVPDEILATPAKGRRFLASGYHRGQAAVLEGPTGNCLANGLDGGVVIVYGNASDDVADGMLSGRVVVHGDARDVLGQAMQGGVILVRGSAGNRVALQMREYEDKDALYHIDGEVNPAGLTPNSPALVVGGGVDDYFGEYMAGGVAVVLNLVEGPEGLTLDGAPEHATGRHVGSGMVGGRLYIRGTVEEGQVGLSGTETDVATYLDAMVAEGVVTPAQRDTAAATADPAALRQSLPAGARRVARFVESKYYARPRRAVRTLDRDDRALLGRALESFFEAFSVPSKVRDEVWSSTWTVIDGRGGATDKQEEG